MFPHVRSLIDDKLRKSSFDSKSTSRFSRQLLGACQTSDIFMRNGVRGEELKADMRESWRFQEKCPQGLAWHPSSPSPEGGEGGLPSDL
jgi:hypothetical protein